MSSYPGPAPESIVSALLPWSAASARDLPWRRRRDPYAVWISEAMLQQTQVATVLPYFERWMARFPDVQALASAALDEVLKAWEGLGYYARARNLHRAAQEIVSRHAGQLPSNRRALLALPGIGAYTAGAILSLAFGQPEPVLDGNVRRVLCRVYDVDRDPRESATEAELWELARGLVRAAPAGEPGRVNEALMELGALACTPRSPACLACPLTALCLAHSRGVEAERPRRSPRRQIPHHEAVAAVVRDAAGCYLIVRRPERGLLGGLWGFPGGIVQPDETLAERLVRSVAEQAGCSVLPGPQLTEIRHTYTHFRITLHAFRCALVDAGAAPSGSLPSAWVAAGDLAAYPFPVTDSKILGVLRAAAPVLSQ